jgi:hypothetical protein
MFSIFVYVVCRHLVQILELGSAYDKAFSDTGQHKHSRRSLPYIGLKSVEDSTYLTPISLHDGWKMYVGYRKYVKQYYMQVIRYCYQNQEISFVIGM